MNKVLIINIKNKIKSLLKKHFLFLFKINLENILNY